MSQIFNYSGDDDFYHGASLYTTPKEGGLFLSLGENVDVFFPRKRARVTAPFVVPHKPQVSLDVLPDECLFEILTRLPGDSDRSICASVSKRWLNLLSSIPNKPNHDVNKPESEPEFDGFLTRVLEGKKATDVRLMALAVGTAGRGGLGKLVIRGSSSVSDSGLRAVARCAPSLRSLSLWNVPLVGDEGIVEIAKGCPKLEKIDLTGCPRVTSRALLALAKGCPSLTTITLDGCQSIGNEGFQGFENLRSVTIKDCPLVGDQGIASLMSSTTLNLTKLKLHGLNITDVSLAVIGHYGKMVNDLVVSGLPNVNERGFWVMGSAQGLQNLKSLTISSCQGVTDVALETLAKGCPNLKHFTLKKGAFVSDNGLVSFAKAARSLESLSLEECHRITQIGFLGLLLNAGSNLKNISLSACFGFRDMALGLPLPESPARVKSITVRNCPGLGDMTLAMVARLCPNLQTLDLTGLPGLTDVGLLSVIESSEAGDGLVKVNLSGCVNVTDHVVSALARTHGGTLEALSLEGCGKVTDAGLKTLAEECLVLAELDVSKCAITDLGVGSLARSNHLGLRVLGLAGCSGLTDKSVPFLAKLGRALVGLNLQHCNGLTAKAIDMLVDRLYKCDILA